MTRPAERARRSGVGRRLTAGAAILTLTASGALAACSDDEEPPSTSLAPTTTEPAAATSSIAPEGDGGQSGAKPGRIPENIDPPGGTTPDSRKPNDDAWGSTNDDAGDQTEGP